jgi:hypothetical protein
MVSSGTVVIVDPDPTIGSIWAEVAAYAGFAAEVVPSFPAHLVRPDIRAFVVRASRDACRVPREWKSGARPRFIALATETAGDVDLKDFDVVLPCDGQVHALYTALHSLAEVNR